MAQPTPSRFPPVVCTVDVVLLTLLDNTLCVGLLRRERPPFEGVPALPGGYVHAQQDSSTYATAVRVLATKLGISSPYLEQLATFSGPARDPRGWSLSVAYTALVAPSRLNTQLPNFRVFPVDELPPLPFDHSLILETAVARVRNKSVYSSLPVHFCPERFTLPELQSVYEAVIGERLNKVSFRRKIEDLALLVPVTGELTRGQAHRPAQLYTLRPEYRKQLALAERGFGVS